MPHGAVSLSNARTRATARCRLGPRPQRAPTKDQPGGQMTPGGSAARPGLAGVWLTAEPVQAPIGPLLLAMLAPNLPNPAPREAEVEELGRGVKLTGAVLEYLGLQTVA